MTTSTPDDFESEAGDAGTTAGAKHYVIKVPGFQEVSGPSGVTIPSTLASGTTFADGTTSISTFSGNSFVRLGSSPTGTDWTTSPYQASVNLARLAGDPAQITASQSITVGSSGDITAGNEEDSNASTLATGTGFVDAFKDGAGVPGPYGYEGDSNYLLGFADDTRFHATGNDRNPKKTLVTGKPVDNDHRNRQAETLRLLTKGGWWDHSDGNRITTTAGDKIEVIQGNYKMVVLGRQSVPTMPSTAVDLSYCYGKSSGLAAALAAWYADQTSSTKLAAVNTAWSAPTVSTADQNGITAQQIRDQYTYNSEATSLVGNSLITDVSGGHFQEQYPSPTPCIKTVEYVLDSGTGEWTLYQDNGLGNLVTKLKGRTVDLFQGPKRETYVGSNAVGTDSAGSLDPQIIAATWAKSIYSQTGAPDKPIGATSSTATTHDAVTPAADGSVVAKTWASRVESYIGSSDTQVTHVRSETHASNDGHEAIHNLAKAYKGNIYSETNAEFGKVANFTTAGVITNVALAKGAVANVTAAGGDVVNVTTAPVAVNVTGAAGVINLTAALDVVNITAAGNIVNINLAGCMDNIDLTPFNYHWGVAQVDMSAWKSVIAGRVDIGLSPAAATMAASTMKAARIAATAMTTVGVLGAVVGGIGIGIGESVKPT